MHELRESGFRLEFRGEASAGADDSLRALAMMSKADLSFVFV